MTETEELRAAVELPAAKVHALDIVVDGDRATGRGHAPHLRRDADAGRFWVFQVSANTWRWARTPQARRIAERVNADLDGTEGLRAMLAPPGPGPTGGGDQHR
ncbi:nuclear transport factor 2 family protein [Streptomyces sp. NPDC057927]